MTIVGLIHELNGVFGISFPDVPGCISAGDSVEHAIERGGKALGIHLSSMEVDGDPLPLPRSAAEIAADPLWQEDLIDAILVDVPVRLGGEA